MRKLASPALSRHRFGSPGSCQRCCSRWPGARLSEGPAGVALGPAPSVGLRLAHTAGQQARWCWAQVAPSSAQVRAFQVSATEPRSRLTRGVAQLVASANSRSANSLAALLGSQTLCIGGHGLRLPRQLQTFFPLVFLLCLFIYWLSCQGAVFIIIITITIIVFTWSATHPLSPGSGLGVTGAGQGLRGTEPACGPAQARAREGRPPGTRWAGSRASTGALARTPTHAL